MLASSICVPLTKPVRIPDHLAFVVPLAVDRSLAEKTARAAILESFLRPHDIDGARVARMTLAFVPFWRLDVAASGFHVGLTTMRFKEGGSSWPVPMGGARHREAVLLVTARRNFPFKPTLLHVPGVLATSHGVPALRAFQINLEETVPRSSYSFPEAEIVDPDVPLALAEHDAKERILRTVEPSTAIYAKYEPTVRSAAFVHYPLYIAPYEYEGHANAHPGESYYVIVSGRSGKVVGEKHPSALKSLARKFRRFLA